MIKIDLHTHSEASKDGGITPNQYAEVLKNEILDVIAITDHDRIDFAQGMQKALGADKIIVGEEITTTDGEIIGLYLQTKVEPHQSPQATVQAILDQGGLVCIPHPFETVRKGIAIETLDQIKDDVTIVESYNGRAFIQNFGIQASKWAQESGKVTAANSDAHGAAGLGKTYTVIQKRPTKETLAIELASAQKVQKRPPIYTLLYPKYNRVKKLMSGRK